MYDPSAVKKQKKKKRITWITIVSAITVTALGIVAFLSTYVGNFTITVIDYQSRLAMSNKSDMSNKTSFQKMQAFTNAVPYSLDTVNEFSPDTLDPENPDKALHSEIFNIDTGTKTIEATALYLYTFYVTNVGDGPCYYYYGFNLTEEKASDAGLFISSMIRIRVFENRYSSSGTITHDYIDYTKENTGYIESDLDDDTKTYLSNCTKSVEDGSLVYFNDDKSIITSSPSATRLYPNEVLRYTFAMWIEGADPDTTGEFFAVNVPIRLSAYIGSKSAEVE